jgi:mannose-6-phosphate isomerase-like protein (cupin superfamily)
VSRRPPWQVARFDEIERRDSWIPVREHLGIEAFGINAYIARDDGTIIPEHDETSSGQEELYVVLDGAATFVVDGTEVDAPAGTLVFVRPQSRRVARGEATILAIGATPGEAYRGFNWGGAWRQHRESLAQYSEGRYAEAADTVRRALAAMPDHAGLNYNFACFAVLAGERDDDVFDHLRRAVASFPPFREQARADNDFAAVRDDPRFEEALA